MRTILCLMALGGSVLPACGEDALSVSKSPSDLQYGETVLPADQAGVDAPLRRASDQPWIDLSRFRKVRLPAGRVVLEVDYRIMAEPVRDAFLVFKSANGRRVQPLELRGQDKEATLQLPMISEPVPEQVELWIEYGKGPFLPTNGRPSFKVSNSVVIGAIGQLTQPREWKDDETKAYETLLKAQVPAKPVPPPDPPEGFVLSGDQTLIPGMPVKFFAGPTGWQDAEALGEWSGGVVFRRSGDAAPSGRQVPPMAPRNQIVVSVAVLEQARTKPESFTPSVRLLAGTLSIVTDDVEPVTDKTPLQAGATVRVAGHGGGWTDAICLNLPAAGKVRVKEIGSFHQREHEVELTQLAISKSVLAELKKPDAAKVFAATFDKLDTEWAAERRKRAHIRDYLATFPLPDDHQPLAEDATVKKGDRLRASWASKWYNVTAVAVSTEGPVEIEWEGFKGGWKEFLSRKSLFVVSKPQRPAVDAPEDVPTVRRKPAGKCTLTLESSGRKRIAVAKVVMEATGLELKDSLEVVNEAPIALRHTLTLEAAEAFRKQIESAGGKATVESND